MFCLFPPTESALFNFAIQRLWNKKSLLNFQEHFYPLLLNVIMFMYSGCDLCGDPGISNFGNRLPHFILTPSGWPSPSHLVQLKGWLTFIKCDFSHRLRIGGNTRDGVLFPCHPRCCHVHLKVWFGRRNWRRGATVQVSYLYIFILGQWKLSQNGY